MRRSLLLIAALVACNRTTEPTAPPATPDPPIHDLEVARTSRPLLERARHGPDVDATITALGRIGDADATAELLALIRTGGDPRAARALGVAKLLGSEFDLPAAEAAILALWPSRSADDRAVLAEALGRLGSAAALPTLTAALRDPAPARESAALALGLLGRRAVPLDVQTRDALVAAAVVDDPELRRAVAYALAHEHDPPAHDLLARTLADLTVGPDPETRALALTGLNRRKLYPPHIRPLHPGHLLHHAALDDPDYRVRVVAVRGLLARGHAADIEHMLTWTRGVIADPRGIHPALEILAGLHDLLDRPDAIHLSQKPDQPSVKPTTKPTRPTRPGKPSNLSPGPGSPQPASTPPRPGSPASTQPDLSQPPASTDLSQKPATLPPAWRDLIAAIAADAEALAADAPEHTRTRLARITCHAGALLARDPAWRTPLTCDGHPPHLTAALTADLLGRGLGGPQIERLMRLDTLRRDPDPRIRAAAVSALLKMRRHEPVPDAWLLDALADPSPAVVGNLADALAAKPPQQQPPISEPVRAALAARATAELTRETELYASLTAALAAVAAPADPCTAGLRHSNPSVRAAARTCVTTLGGRDPGPQLPEAPPPRPPHPPKPGPKIRWRLTSERGVIDVHLDPAAAPWHVAAIVAHTRAGFYNNLTFHRVAPGFVVQGGDPEGTGWGGPGYTMPSEPGPARFTRGAVGIADAGKDTGGSQFFFMQARAPHLEGRFTRIGEVSGGIDVIDALLVGDKILRAEILPP